MNPSPTNMKQDTDTDVATSKQELQDKVIDRIVSMADCGGIHAMGERGNGFPTFFVEPYPIVVAKRREVMKREFQRFLSDTVSDELQKVSDILTGSKDFRIEPGVNLGLTIGQIRAIRLVIEARKERL